MDQFDEDPFMTAGSFGGGFGTTDGSNTKNLDDILMGNDAFSSTISNPLAPSSTLSDENPLSNEAPTANGTTSADEVAQGISKIQMGSTERLVEKNDVNLDHFEVTISDPTTVGEGMKAHTVYKICTKTNSKDFKSPEQTVYRRFREFLWLEQQLVSNNPGIVVPPPPDKMVIGRFEQDFVVNRCVLLQRMMIKIVEHPILQKDLDLRAFLESETFQFDQDKKKKEEKSVGFFNKLGNVMSSMSTKVEDPDEFFDNKKAYVDLMDSNFKNALKSVDSLIKQREDLANSYLEFAEVFKNFSNLEINKEIESFIKTFAEVHKNIGELEQAQTHMDVYHMANMLDELVRIIGAIKNALAYRIRALQAWKTAEQNLIKARINLEKGRLSSKNNPNKLAQLETDIKEGEEKVVSTKQEFELTSQRLKSEFIRFEELKVQDVQTALQGFLQSIQENQKKTVNLWEDFIRTYENE